MRTRQQISAKCLLLGIGLSALLASPAAQPEDARAKGKNSRALEAGTQRNAPGVLADGLGHSAPVPGGQPTKRPDLWAGKLAALDAGSLDAIRGGFEMPDSNIRFSFGIERVVYINNQMVASTALNLKDLQSASGGGSGPPVQPDAALEVIKIGPGNTFPIQLAPELAGTVIQNSMDGQRIQTITTINAAVNSAQVLRSMALQSAIRDGLIGSLRR